MAEEEYASEAAIVTILLSRSATTGEFIIFCATPYASFRRMTKGVMFDLCHWSLEK